MSKQATAWCAVLGGFAVLVAFAVYMSEQNGAGDEPNYGFALVLAVAGAFLILIAVISANGRRQDG